MRHFLNISKDLGKSQYLVQGAGGNTSVKIGDNLIVKASGTFLRDMRVAYGYITCQYKPIAKYLMNIKHVNKTKETNFDNFIEKYINKKQSFGIPSIETSFHIVIPSKYILHTHSVYVNVFSCMEGGKEILHKILDLPFLFLPYNNPGLSLGLTLSKYKKPARIIILKNHGIITHSNNPKEALELTQKVNKKIIQYLKHKQIYKPFLVTNRQADLSKHLFPDSAVYSQINFESLPSAKSQVYYEIASAHNYIFDTITALGGKPVYIENKDIKYILDMNKEKYRINKLKND